jgi:Flp pilus assembly protein TadG
LPHARSSEGSTVASTGKHRSAGRATEDGAVAVEFALVLPLLMALLVGIVTAGFAFNNTLGVTDGVNEGARFGATALGDGSWGNTVQQRTMTQTYLNLPGHPAIVTSTMVCAKLLKAPATQLQASSCNTAVAGTEPPNPAGVAAGTCLVKVWAAIPVTFDLALLGSYTATVKRHSVSLYERTCP